MTAIDLWKSADSREKSELTVIDFTSVVISWMLTTKPAGYTMQLIHKCNKMVYWQEDDDAQEDTIRMIASHCILLEIIHTLPINPGAYHSSSANVAAFSYQR
jgi:hypothetical protein